MLKVLSQITALLLVLDVVFNDLNFYHINFIPYILLILPILFSVSFIYYKAYPYKIIMRFLFPFAIFISYITLVILFNFEEQIQRNGQTITGLQFNLPVVVKYCLYFFLGFGIEYLTKKNIILLLMILLFGFIRMIDFKTFTFNFLLLFDPDQRSVIASAADISTLMLIILYSKDNSRNYWIILLSAIFLCVIFISGSRTTFILLFLSFLLFLKIRLKLLIIIGIAFFPIQKILINYISHHENLISEFRLLKLLNYNEDKSFIARGILLKSGLTDILENPFMGKYGNQLHTKIIDDNGNRWGAYIHNFLSYYRQFGLLPFLLFIYQIGYSSFILLRNDKKYLPLISFILISIVFSRSYTFPYVFILIGLAVSNLTVNTANKNMIVL